MTKIARFIWSSCGLVIVTALAVSALSLAASAVATAFSLIRSAMS